MISFEATNIVVIDQASIKAVEHLKFSQMDCNVDRNMVTIPVVVMLVTTPVARIKMVTPIRFNVNQEMLLAICSDFTDLLQAK